MNLLTIRPSGAGGKNIGEYLKKYNDHYWISHLMELHTRTNKKSVLKCWFTTSYLSSIVFLRRVSLDPYWFFEAIETENSTTSVSSDTQLVYFIFNNKNT